MSYLLERLTHRIPQPIITKGRAYFRGGRVTILDSDAGGVEALVQGTETYDVSLHWVGSALRASCTCPHYESSGICKHIWATVEQAHQQRRLGFPKASGPLRLVPYHLEAPPTSAAPATRSESRPVKDASGPGRASWKRIIKRLADTRTASPEPEPARESQVLYTLSLSELRNSGVPRLQAVEAFRKKNGDWSKPRPFQPTPSQIAALKQEDRQILLMLRGATPAHAWKGYASPNAYQADTTLWEHLAPLLCRTGRFTANEADPLSGPFFTLDEGPAWIFHLIVDVASAKTVRVRGELWRGEERRPLDEPRVVTASGWMFDTSHIARIDHRDSFPWIALLREQHEITVPRDEVDQFIESTMLLPMSAPLSLPADLAFTQETGRFTPALDLTVNAYEPAVFDARLSFDYGGRVFRSRDTERGFRTAGARIFTLRDRTAEEQCRAALSELGLRRPRYAFGDATIDVELPEKRLPEILRALGRKGWRIVFKGRPIRSAGTFSMEVVSGVDWFDLHAKADFDGIPVPMPDLLRAARERLDTLVLADGSIAAIPQDWQQRLAALASFSSADKDALRFRRSQAALLDALLAEQPGVNVDEQFAAAREQVKSFRSIAPADPPATFRGTLRDYQRDGLGWLDFLRAHHFGGCLADDMGLGKTVQVLAMLEARRLAGAGPSLVVLPKSLLYNWRAEAARFTPAMRVIDHHGLSRAKSSGHLSDYDLILTTYGTLRIDAALLKDIEFDYVVLDEAQAIKNASTSQAKAARLLRARHRLAMSGTPIENHLGELWSLFEFLNPGFLGRASVFQELAANGADESARALLARALRPFILRRTKKEVARELPDRMEDTLWCELPPKQRKIYDELRDHYRASLLGVIDAKGLGRSKIQVLEALLRLRQAACHPALIDKSKDSESSAKLEVLLAQLEELREEDHKALVFSQFTSFLALVRKELDARGIPYEYLDGKTKDRKACVDRFQTDPACKVFLISLKAGGVGLNLTAAEYVFLLDPWWNPAVEAQAIDRAHRIGQTRKVFAYRLIAKDTIEEKVLDLQQSKRALADAIISADNSLIRNLTREDLEHLLA
jgi:superfamily II DNA or RNA helicase